MVYVYASAVGSELVHHIKSNNHRYVHFKELHGQIQISLNIRSVNYIYDSVGIFGKNKITGNDLLAAIRRHGVDTRQIGYQSVGMSLDSSILSVNSNTREISYVLLGSGKAVEKSGFSAVLIAHKSKLHDRSFRERITVALQVEAASLSETRMLNALAFRFFLRRNTFLFAGINDDLFGICQPQCQLITVDPHLDRIPHRSILYHSKLSTGKNTHIKQMLTKSALTL